MSYLTLARESAREATAGFWHAKYLVVCHGRRWRTHCYLIVACATSGKEAATGDACEK